MKKLENDYFFFHAVSRSVELDGEVPERSQQVTDKLSWQMANDIN
jgi:hypothetical protein